MMIPLVSLSVSSAGMSGVCSPLAVTEWISIRPGLCAVGAAALIQFLSGVLPFPPCGVVSWVLSVFCTR